MDHRRLSGGAWPEAVTALLWLALCALLWRAPLTHDVVWQLWIARQLVHGAQLYRDILEINPPLWFWSAMPVQHLAALLGVPAVRVMSVAVFLLIGLTLVHLSALNRQLAAPRRLGLLLLALAALVVVPISDFGQREHLALIGALPYALLLARRVEGRPVSPWLAVSIGLLAAYGFALKHYFVAVPVALEVWLFWRGRQYWRLVRPETLVLAVCAALYVAAVAVLTPDFLGTIVPLVRVAYGGYENPIGYLLLKPWIAGWLLTAWVAWRLRAHLSADGKAVLLVAAAFLLGYVAQQKGWRYHALAVSGACTFAVGLCIVHWQGSFRALLSHPLAVVAPALFVALGLFWGPYDNPYARDMRAALSLARPGEPVALLAVNPSLAWPMVDDAGLAWNSRYFSYWMLPAIYRARPDDTNYADVQRLKADILRQAREDYTCHPPQLIVVDDLRKSASMAATGKTHLLDFFRQDPVLRDLFATYRPVRQVGRFLVMLPTRAIAPSGAPDCRSIY